MLENNRGDQARRSEGVVRNSQFYAILLAIMVAPRMSNLGALACAVFYLVCTFAAMWKEAK